MNTVITRTSCLLGAALLSCSAFADGPGTTIEAEALNENLSSNYRLTSAEDNPDLHYVGYFGGDSLLCYNDINLTGVQSIELEYSRGIDDPGRFAVVIHDGTGLGQYTNLGEQYTSPTGGWETFERRRIGLARQVSGHHTLCFFGVEGGGIFNLDKFTLSDQPGEHDGITWRPDAMPTVFSAAGYKFTLERVAESPTELWAMAFLPDGTMVATQKSGGLLLFRNGERLGPIEGTPEVWNGAQGGLLAVKPHPDYNNNGWLYLTYSDVGDNGTTMTRVARGQLDGLKWVNGQTVYETPARFYSEYYAHFGSRLAFQDDYVYFSVGDRGQGDLAQDLGYPYGKIHRLHADGRVPDDNPFVENNEALASIWSYGHRNPQGMTTHPQNGDVWSTEHGPRGGDEINLIRKGLNYGWPLVSHGINYDGTIVSESPYMDGVEPPLHHWTPSIGVSQLEFYTGDKFPKWRNQLLVASLGRQELRLVHTSGSEVTSDELVLQNVGRIRDVVNGPDGYPYVVITHPQGTIYRLVPAD